MKHISSQLLRIDEIAGMFYTVEGRKTSRLVIYGTGAPGVPDTGLLSDAPFILDFIVDLFVPDYLGFGRSDGIFTPTNCITTFLQVYRAVTTGVMAGNHYSNLQQFLKYDEVFFIARSFGGMYITWLPLFDQSITNLCLISPIIDYVECGKLPGEETSEQFMRAMNGDGFGHLYRGIDKPVWKKHFANEDALCPMKDVSHLQNATVFIAHGKQDTNINAKHSVAYYDLLIKTFPEKQEQFTLQVYDGDHGSSTSNKAVIDYLQWKQVPKTF